MTQNNNEVEVTIEDTTHLLRVDNHEYIHIHKIRWKIGASISVSELHLNIDLFPNPTQGTLYIQLKNPIEEKLSIRVLSITGQEILKKSINNNTETTQINLEKLTSGVYIINFYANDKLIVSKKIVKN